VARPTEVFVPDIQFPRVYVVTGPDLEWEGKVTQGCI
jgi:hypothetical protein